MKETTQAELTNYCCPVCNSQMLSYHGDRVTATNGVTLRCEDSTCKTPENVEGHGRTVARAYEVVLAKYAGARMDIEVTESETEPVEVEAAKPVVKRGRGRPPKSKAVESEELPL